MAVTRAFLVAGLGFGDEGKGAYVDRLARTEGVHTVVRYNGGAQAGHNVIAPDGRHHCFSQFGSGTFVPGVETFLSRYMLVNPLRLDAEDAHLRAVGVADAFDRLAIDGRAPMTTVFHVAANRLTEMARGNGRHGSCGLGISETAVDVRDMGEDMTYVRDLRRPNAIAFKLDAIRRRKIRQLAAILPGLRGCEAAETELDILEGEGVVEACVERYRDVASRLRIVSDGHAARMLARPGAVAFEGAQGVLLDQTYGFYPYNTHTDITFRNADVLIRDAAAGSVDVVLVGMLRAYATRHGAGPFVTEDASLASVLPEADNVFDVWQQGFRVGRFDLVAARYAISVVGGIHHLHVTCMDRIATLPEPPSVCIGYRVDSADEDLFNMRSGMAVAIRVPRPTDNVRQQRVTDALGRAVPLLLSFGGDIGAYPVRLAERLGVPVDGTPLR